MPAVSVSSTVLVDSTRSVSGRPYGGVSTEKRRNKSASINIELACRLLLSEQLLLVLTSTNPSAGTTSSR